jgi:NAD(P)-dependent dehydrogenase (short-subunit alcohol dehydrogenase family)
MNESAAVAPGAARWVMVLGVSSGFGAATARAFAREGFDVLGVHLDRKQGLEAVDALRREIEGMGRKAHFVNKNAADDVARGEMIDEFAGVLGSAQIHVVLHTLAFGSLVYYVPPTPQDKAASRKQIEMTLDVMANSLVYWVQALMERELLAKGGRVYAMTSSGSHTAWESYGPVSAAKAALEAHVRQLCMELAPHRITINAVLAGVTETPALAKIPGNDRLKAKATSKNPHHRLTRPEDVASCLVELARPGTYWMTGNVIRVDGGEDFCA